MQRRLAPLWDQKKNSFANYLFRISDQATQLLTQLYMHQEKRKVAFYVYTMYK